jgi:ribonuclease BN (tRNA processing enzyme)
MQTQNYIKFLGTAGARYVMAKQLRSSGGIFICANGKNILLDPGPGALVKLASSRPAIDVTKIDAVILSHAHLDHSNDVNAIIDGMTGGGFDKKGMLFCPAECLEGDSAVVLHYLRPFLDSITVLEPRKSYRVGDLKFRTSLRHDHAAETYGLIFEINKKKVSFLVDTKFFPDLIKSYKDSDIMIINVVRKAPKPGADIRHLSIDDVKALIAVIKPSRVILTHFGMTMLQAKPFKVASDLTAELGIEVTAATDGLKIEL